MKKEQKRLAHKERKTEKFNKKDARYFEKYGVHLNEVQRKEKKEKVKIKYLRKFLPFLRGSPLLATALIILFFVIIAVNTIHPLLFSWATDALVANDLQLALILVIAYGVADLFLSVLIYLNYTCSSKFFNRMIDKIRISLIDDLAKTKISKLNEVKSGEILSRVSSDPESFTNNFDRILEQLRWLLRRIGRVVIFFVFSWKLGLFLIISGVIIYIIDRIYANKKFIPANKRNKIINDKYNSQVTEMTRGIRDIKNLNIFSHFYEKFQTISKFKRNSQTNLDSKGNFMDLIILDGSVGLASIFAFIYALFLTVGGEISIGNLLTILMYNYEAFYLFANISMMNNCLQEMEISAKRMYELKDNEQYPKEVFGKSKLTSPEGNIRFKNVCFSYKDEKVFENLSFEIKAGQSIGIVGRSGEGKSTILNLIPRIYDVDSGSIEIDDIDVRELTQDSLRNTVSMVSQSPYIFDLTIEENLRLVKPDATQKELEEVCQKAQILDFIQSKPDGFKTRIGEGGVILSGGQKQRLALARAFLKNSKILLLDEATSALDNNSQAQVKEAIYNLQNSCTLVIVAHRLSTVIDCDKILVLDGHKLIAEGTHTELFKNCKVYRKLYEQDDLS